MVNSREDTIDDLLRTIRRLNELGNLAAVLVHMNDTYLIAEQYLDEKLHWPGLARVSQLISRIKDAAGDENDGERVLVVHSGDFLSPSFLSNRCGTHGRHMAHLLSICGVKYVTVGNHEFDHDAKNDSSILMSILRSRAVKFRSISTNIAPPRKSRCFRRIAYWPEEDPYLAIVGVAGDETLKVAEGHSFCVEEVEPALTRSLRRIKRDSRIRCLVVLSHLSRNEDKELQTFLDHAWRSNGCAYILGGHDHHIDWQERSYCISLSKNTSNCGSLTAILITKAFAAAPAKIWGEPRRKNPTLEEDIASLRSVEADPRLDELFWRSFESEEGLDAFIEAKWALDGEAARERLQSIRSKLPTIVQEAITFYRNKAEACTRPDFIEAYCHHIEQTAEQFGSYAADGAHVLYQVARGSIRSEIYSGAVESNSGPTTRERLQFFWNISGSAFSEVEPCPKVQDHIEHWITFKKSKMSGDADEIVADFTEVSRTCSALDAFDSHLRMRSTNFGNFVADAVAIATKVDIALIHAGSFRFDRALDLRLRLEDLYETFIYDGPESIAIIELSEKLVNAAIEHASSAPGTGRFLQVSRGIDGIGKNDGKNLRIAISSFLLINDQDGYRSLFEEKFGFVPNIKESHSLIKFVRSSAREVTYDETIRLEATPKLTADEQWANKFVELVDILIWALPDSKHSSVGEQIRDRKCFLYEWEKEGTDGVSLRKIYLDLYSHVEKLLGQPDWVFSPFPPQRINEVYRNMADNELIHRENVPYHDYFLESAGWVYWWHNQHYYANKENGKSDN